MASAAIAATAARRKGGERITVDSILAGERPRRGRIEQNGLFGPGPQ